MLIIVQLSENHATIFRKCRITNRNNYLISRGIERQRPNWWFLSLLKVFSSIRTYVSDIAVNVVRFGSVSCKTTLNNISVAVETSV